MSTMDETERKRSRIAVLWLYHTLKGAGYVYLDQKHAGYDRFISRLAADMKAERFGMTKISGDWVYDFLSQLNKSADKVSLPLQSDQYPATTCFDNEWALQVGLDIMRFFLLSGYMSISYSSLRRTVGDVSTALGVPFNDMADLFERILVGFFTKELARQ